MSEKVWVAQLDIAREGFSGTWLTVHKTRERARLAIATRAQMHGVSDLFARALRQDTSTSNEVASSTAVREGPREITWVINRHTVD